MDTDLHYFIWNLLGYEIQVLESLGLQEMFMETIINSRIREEREKQFKVKSLGNYVINSYVKTEW